MNKKLLVKAIFFITLFAAAISAQTPKPSATPPGETDDTIKISTTLIQVDVTVTDKDGKIVTDLKPEDFEVYENGKKQDITNFSFIAVDSKTKPAETVNAPTVSNNKNSIPLPPVKLKAGQVRRTYALVVDSLGLSFESVRHVQQSLKKFVNEQMQEGDLVAIIRIGGGIGALQSFTSDKRQLLIAIDKIKWNSYGRSGISTFEPIQKDIKEEIQSRSKSNRTVEGSDADREFQRQTDEFRHDNFSVATLHVLNNIIKVMSDFPERKAIMFFSEGFRLNGANRILAEMKVLADRANRSSVVIYTLDPRGLQNPGMAFAEDDITTVVPDDPGAGRLDSDPRDARTTGFRESQMSLRYLADETGGIPFVNQNNLNKGMQMALNDQSGYYLLGYQPDDETFDPKKNKFNKLEIKVKSPNLKVRSRSGFYGHTDTKTEKQSKSSESPLYQAIASPFQEKGLDIRLTTMVGNNAKQGDYIRALFHIKGEDLTFTDEADGTKKVVLDVVVVTLDEDGKVVDEFNRTYPIRIPKQGFQTVLQNGLDYSTDMPVKKPGFYSFRLAVRDNNSKRLGSVGDFVEIPDTKKDKFFMSGLYTTTVTNENKPLFPKNRPAEAAFAPVFFNTIPSIRQYYAGSVLSYVYNIYNSKPDEVTNQAKLTRQIRLYKDGKLLADGAEKPVEIQPQSDISRIQDYGFLLLNEKAETGEYILQIIIRDKLASKTTSQWIDFEVVK